MNPLRTLENMIAGLVEGTFGRVFRTEVRPMELARKLAREMDENVTTSVSRVYAPNEYGVWLSPGDRARYEGVEDEVIDELCAYLLEHARGEGLTLGSRPRIAFHTDDDLQLGEFGIEAGFAREDEERERPESPAPRAERAQAGAAGASWERPAPVDAHGSALAPAPEAPPEQRGATMIYSNSERMREELARSGAQRRSKALLVIEGRRMLLPPRGGVVGRGRDCDIVLEDSGVSRRHAELRPGDGGWSIEDLGSTNGVRVNGSLIRGSQGLRSGDRVELGSTEMLFEIA